MLRTSFLALCELLRPHIEDLTTEVRLCFLHLRVDGDIFFKIARVDRILFYFIFFKETGKSQFRKN